MANNDIDINTTFNNLNECIANLKQNLTLIQQQVKNVEKTVNRELKNLKKEADKNKNKGNRKPSGFAKPQRVSNELCDFMNKPSGSEVARTEVTQYIIKYIKDNSLQKTGNKKIITPDGNLTKLFGDHNESEVTYFNLQRLMNKHFDPEFFQPVTN